ncbi:uncharacterized protein FYW23_001097 [Sylvia borin]
MQDVHFLRGKVAARTAASARVKKGEVPGQAGTGNIAIGASVDPPYSFVSFDSPKSERRYIPGNTWTEITKWGCLIGTTSPLPPTADEPASTTALPALRGQRPQCPEPRRPQPSHPAAPAQRCPPALPRGGPVPAPRTSPASPFRYRPGARRRQGSGRGGLGPARTGSVSVRGSAPRRALPVRLPLPAAGRGRPRAPPRGLRARRAGNRGGRARRRRAGEGERTSPRVPGGPGGGWERGRECRSGCEPSRYLHQDGRVVKALDLRSNGRMSAWVRTPLLIWCVVIPYWEHSWSTKKLLFNFSKNKLCLLPLPTLKIKKMLQSNIFSTDYFCRMSR